MFCSQMRLLAASHKPLIIAFDYKTFIVVFSESAYNPFICKKRLLKVWLDMHKCAYYRFEVNAIITRNK